jgi:hypothetical protein
MCMEGLTKFSQEDLCQLKFMLIFFSLGVNLLLDIRASQVENYWGPFLQLTTHMIIRAVYGGGGCRGDQIVYMLGCP